MRTPSLGLSFSSLVSQGGNYRPFVRYKFSDGTPGTVLTLPSGLTFFRNSNGYSIPLGDNSFVENGSGGLDLSANNPRCGRAKTGGLVGLLIEAPSTNLCLHSRDMTQASWTAGSGATTTSNAGISPDGQTLAERIVVTSGGFSKYRNLGALTAGKKYTGSCWLKEYTAGSEYRIGLVESATAWGYTGGPGQAIGANWVRKSVTRTYPSGSELWIPFDGSSRSSPSSIAAQSCDLLMDAHQVEKKPYATSFIGTTSAANTRAGERLLIQASEVSKYSQQGRFGVYFKFEALCASSELDADNFEGTLLAFNGGNDGQFFVDATNKYFYLWNGSEYSQSANNAVSWSKGDTIEIWVIFGAGKTLCKYRINGGAVQTVSFSVKDDTLTAVGNTNGWDAISTGTVGQFPMVLDTMEFFPWQYPPF